MRFINVLGSRNMTYLSYFGLFFPLTAPVPLSNNMAAHPGTPLTPETFRGQLERPVFAGTVRDNLQFSVNPREYFQHHGERQSNTGSNPENHNK